VSTNPVAKSVYAQSNALGQNGGGNAEQDIEQAQTSNQDDQVVSGDSSILSGNGIQCNSQINSMTTMSISDGICAIGGLNIPDSNDDKVKVKLKIQFIVDPQCVPGRSTNHGCDAKAGGYNIKSGPGTGNIFRGDVTVGEGQTGKTIEVSLPYDRFIHVIMGIPASNLRMNGYEIISSQIDSKPDGYTCVQTHGLLETISCSTFNAAMDGQEKVFSFTFKISDILT
jgi:hypothetical protein